MQLPHKRIDDCPNRCMLYWKDKIDLDRCEHCGVDRYEKKTLREKDIAKKVLIYFPIRPRLHRLYATKSTAEQMRWHSENSCVRGSMAHLCNSEVWKHLDATFKEFAIETRMFDWVCALMGSPHLVILADVLLVTSTCNSIRFATLAMYKEVIYVSPSVDSWPKESKG